MTLLIVFCAKYLIYIIALGATAAVLVSPHRQRLALAAVIALPAAYALARLAGFFFSHPQPFVAEHFEPLVAHVVDNSFPSDHTAIAGVFASVAFLADKRAGLVLWALTLLVGFARVAAGLHYTVDIAASVAIALLAVWAVYHAARVVRAQHLL